MLWQGCRRFSHERHSDSAALEPVSFELGRLQWCHVLLAIGCPIIFLKPLIGGSKLPMFVAVFILSCSYPFMFITLQLWSLLVTAASKRQGPSTGSVLEAEDFCNKLWDMREKLENYSTRKAAHKTLQDAYDTKKSCFVWKHLANKAVSECSEEHSPVLAGLIEINVTVAKDAALAAKAIRLGKTACLKQILVALPVVDSLTTHCSDHDSTWQCRVGWSLPHYAARDKPEMLPFLATHGYNLSVADAHDWTPAHEEVGMMFTEPKQRLKFFRELAGMGARRRLRCECNVQKTSSAKKLHAP